MLILAYDTETTGIIKGSDYTNPESPFLASIAMILYDSEAHRIVSSFNAAIKPDDWTMPADAAAINGLTDGYLHRVGIPVSIVIYTAMEIAYKADLRIVHNADFDSKIIAAALWRELSSDEDLAHEVVKRWLEIPTYCTMNCAKEIVGALDKRGKVKYPKLAEAYKFFFDRDLDRAHSANADAVAVLEIYLAIQDRLN